MTTIGDMTAAERKAYNHVPSCVELEGLDAAGTFAHVIFRVEHVVDMHASGEDFYTRQEAGACKRWLKKYAPQSEYAA